MIAAASALALTAPLHAKTLTVAPGENAQSRLQEALIVAQPGDVVELAAGRFMLTDGLSLDVAGVTVRGAGWMPPCSTSPGRTAPGKGCW